MLFCAESPRSFTTGSVHNHVCSALAVRFLPQEVSGYIDYGHRLKTENCEPYFDRKKRLMPRPSDLSFYNWETQMSTSNPTPNFQVGRGRTLPGTFEGVTSKAVWAQEKHSA